MPAYLIIEAHVTDPQGFATYVRATPAVVAHYGGHYLVMGGEQTSLEGVHAPSRTVVSCWSDRDAALAFWNSAEYAAIKPLRAGTGSFRVLLADGVQTQALNDTATEGKAP